MRAVKNSMGLFIKLSMLPFVLYLDQGIFTAGNITLLSSLASVFFIILGLCGILVSDLLMLRYGDGNVHFSPAPSRLVNVGFYARTRHPYLWFFFLYYLGNFLFYTGFSCLSLFYAMGLSLLYLLYLALVQEVQLMHSLGEIYASHRKNVPIWYWKLKIDENDKAGFRPQIVWIFGMLVVRYWYRIKVEGAENIPPSKPFLVVANHESYLDPFLFGLFVPLEIKFVTTADVFATPLMRFLLRGTGSFPMRRHRQDLKSIRTMIRMISNGQVVCIFPEGGRSIDGSPLPILKETLKLIQRCNVPILPVHLDGAYEVWPRWAPNRRRGKVTVSFKEVIPLESQDDLGILEERICEAIFAQNKIFRPVRSRSISKGIDKLLWACYKCRSRNAIEISSGNSVICSHCKTEWQIANDYTMTEMGRDDSLTSITWLKDIEADILDYAFEPDPGLAESSEEKVHLHSPITRYKNDNGAQLDEDLTLTLTGTRMVLCQHQKPLESWPISTITIFTMDYFNAVSIGVGGIRHSFTLPRNEIPLKWQVYFDTLKQTAGNLAPSSAE